MKVTKFCNNKTNTKHFQASNTEISEISLKYLFNVLHFGGGNILTDYIRDFGNSAPVECCNVELRSL